MSDKKPSYRELQHLAAKLGINCYGKKMEELAKEIGDVTANGSGGKSTTSALIRSMWEEGRTIADIAKALGISYNIAYNVVHRAFPHDFDSPGTQKEPSLSERIRELVKQGKSRKEIIAELGCTYQHIYNALRYKKRGAEEDE